MMRKRSLVLLASGLAMSIAGCTPMFTVTKPSTSMQVAQSDASACGASGFLAPGVRVDELQISEFGQCMRSRGYSINAP